MAVDLYGPMRPSDSWSSTEVKTINHNHLWTIKGFSQCDVRYLETSVRIKDSAMQLSSNTTVNINSALISDVSNNNNVLVFKIRLHPQGNKESNKDFCFFQVFASNNSQKFKAKFAVFNTRNEEVPATVYNGTQQLNGYFEYIRRDLLINHIQPQDEIHLLLNLTIISDTITKDSQTTPVIVIPESRPNELAKELEAMFCDKRHTDFKIICRSGTESKEIDVHKVILAARSPVFAAMLEPHTDESQNSCVVYEDIHMECMKEMLFYCYSGRSPQLSTMAFDLLAISDRFQLVGLKDMCGQVLQMGLTADNVCKNLVLADMHSAFDLKNDSIRFIANNSTSVIETEGWSAMVKEHPRLVTEIVAAMSDVSPRNSHLSGFGMEPLAKRTRFD